MTTEQRQVREFMQLFGQDTPNKPCIPSLKVRKLRAQLILEETIELCLGLGFNIECTKSSVRVLECQQPNLKEIADGLADLHYVAYCGTAIACGLDMEPIFAEVHCSNMSKLWSDDDIEQKLYKAPDSKGWFDKDGQRMFIFIVKEHPEIKGMYAYLVKDKHGKVIKSPSHLPANIQPIIDSQCNTSQESR